MKCPVCRESDLVMSERQNIEVDYCPQCRGVWLDRGELDKIIERSLTVETAQSAARAPENRSHSPRVSYDYDRDRDHYRHSYKKKKKGGFLGELFDFD